MSDDVQWDDGYGRCEDCGQRHGEGECPAGHLREVVDRTATMSLYDATNGYTGESYVRVYVWASSETEARKLADAAFAASKTPGPTTGLRLLMRAGAAPFATTPDDAGWEAPGLERM